MNWIEQEKKNIIIVHHNTKISNTNEANSNLQEQVRKATEWANELESKWNEQCQ